jgi:hypothetical protein
MLNAILMVAFFSPPSSMTVYGGTIIVMQKDDDRFIVVADSRSSNDTGTSYWDDACKVIGLGHKMFFFATGKTTLTRTDGKTVFDVNEVVKRGFNDFNRLPNDENRLYLVSFYSALFLKALYQDVSAQWPGPMADGVINGNSVKAIFGGATDDGALIAYLVNINMEPTKASVPPISFTVEKWNAPHPINIFGSREKDGVTEFWAKETERAKLANADLDSQFARNKDADRELLRIKAAVQAAVDWAQNKNMVGGPLDILELRKGQSIHWIQAKPSCK